MMVMFTIITTLISDKPNSNWSLDIIIPERILNIIQSFSQLIFYFWTKRLQLSFRNPRPYGKKSHFPNFFAILSMLDGIVISLMILNVAMWFEYSFVGRPWMHRHRSTTSSMNCGRGRVSTTCLFRPAFYSASTVPYCLTNSKVIWAIVSLRREKKRIMHVQMMRKGIGQAGVERTCSRQLEIWLVIKMTKRK